MDIVTPEEVHRYAVEKGWWDKERPIPELLMLIVSEASEGLESYRNNISEKERHCLSEELADIVIRVWDISVALGFDIADAVNRKHQINLKRPYRHGGKKC